MGKSRLSIALNQTYDIVPAEGERGQFKVSTRSYIYALYNKNGEVVSFHYHPDQTPEVDFCHMHFRRTPEFKRVHFPTGRVAIEEVVAMVIRDFGVKPRRADYQQVLRSGLEKFRDWRTWA